MQKAEENYTRLPKIGKAVIVSNFTNERTYAEDDYKQLETTLTKIGFEKLTGAVEMVNTNLTKQKFIDLYKTAANNDDYGNDTCVLFIVMSFGKPGSIKCDSSPYAEYVEQKDLFEAFQPQICKSLAKKPKIFIIQTIPETRGVLHDEPTAVEPPKMRKIPREADFLIYTCESNCINDKSMNNDHNIFVKSIVEILQEQVVAGTSNLEIQEILLNINNRYKEKRAKLSDLKESCKIPCVTSSLSKRLYLKPLGNLPKHADMPTQGTGQLHCGSVLTT